MFITCWCVKTHQQQQYDLKLPFVACSSMLCKPAHLGLQSRGRFVHR